jgi:hypothetical protein
MDHIGNTLAELSWAIRCVKLYGSTWNHNPIDGLKDNLQCTIICVIWNWNNSYINKKYDKNLAPADSTYLMYEAAM